MEKQICEFCGKSLSSASTFEYGGKIMCSTCLDERTEICEICGTRIWPYNNAGNSETILCQHCYSTHYTYCEDCGALIHQDDAYYEDGSDIPYCYECYQDLCAGTIKNYSFKPMPIFYGDKDLYLGVELEIDVAGESNSNADEIISPANCKNYHLYCKHDGSLNDGFEIVSHPMTLDYHKNNMSWENVMSRAIDLGYRSHQTSTCGLHIHVGRRQLGSTYELQEDTISRIVYFVEAHWNELLKFSRRTEANINRWARRYGLSSTTKETYDKAKKGTDMGRYVSLNLYNDNTIEFRIFRGTLKYSTFVATLELVHEICTQAIDMTDSEFESMCWSDFVKNIDKNRKPALIEYLKSKQLYVNELCESEVDM